MNCVLVKCAIILTLLQIVCSEYSPGCPLHTWSCQNGQCIKSEELCDGNYDCADKSDETVEQCLLRPCPNYAFQCAYGACITGKFKCNGIVNCVDGSDETRYLCNYSADYEEEIQGQCGVPSNMQCKSGECVSNERLCDGREDCMDGSDETVEMCSFLKCPEYSFRCGYGACVTGTSVCDGIKDCKDGSDEIPSICSNITKATTTTVRPPSQHQPISTTLSPSIATSTSTTFEYPSTTETSTSAGIYCASSPITRGISSFPTCYYYGEEVSCYRGIRAGTIANITCAIGYIEKRAKRNSAIIKCDSDGEWTRPKTKCVAECGVLTNEQKLAQTKPWEVTILKRNLKPTYQPICSGVIVSPKVVLSAASCFLSPSNNYNIDHIYYNLIHGYFTQSYIDGYYSNLDVHNISSIIVKSMQKSQALAVLVIVNYFQFSDYLKPICLPTSQSNVFPFYSDNKLNIGRPISRDTSKVYLEYLIGTLEIKENGRRLLTYVNTYDFIPFINRQIRKYSYML